MFKLLTSKWFWLGLVSGGFLLHYLTRDDSCHSSHFCCKSKEDHVDLKAS
ncbi:MAG: hypothetical protein QNL04_09815 [SAR324 cluster bacterium]|nr:hypothetical protein [SAR324 cluster bacterium]